uniref:Uncharacterized protein n=1 Tax=Glossina brevipalpis TaxID=37001 RepID=A0A1A9W3M2_9MUSC
MKHRRRSECSWKLNYFSKWAVPAVRTRLHAGMYGNECLRGGPLPDMVSLGYRLESVIGSANLLHYVQVTDGRDDVVAERAFSRIDSWHSMVTRRGNLMVMNVYPRM